MLKQGLQLSILLLFIMGCAGTVRLAEKDKTTPTQTQVAKPTQTPNQQ